LAIGGGKLTTSGLVEIVEMAKRNYKSKKYDQFKINAPIFIDDYWREHKKSPSLNQVAKKLKKSTSIAARYLKRLHDEGVIVIDENVIYTKAFFEKMLECVSKFYGFA
jgi:hypothetical protein